MILLLTGLAFGWESTCFDENNEKCEDGYAKARGRYRYDEEVGGNPEHRNANEHRLLLEEAMRAAGLPEKLIKSEINLPIYMTEGTVGENDFQDVRPQLWEVDSRMTRTVTVPEMAELPDMSYTMWDWATGNDSCPPDSTWDPQSCHTFKTHMGPLNASHFPPVSEHFYLWYHSLAISRAEECTDFYESLSVDDIERFGELIVACEQQAMLIEGVAQHYLQDTWSMGHMWERWGGTDPNTHYDNGKAMGRAALIAPMVGLIHGARSVAKEFIDEEDLTANDPMCSPPPTGTTVEYVDPFDRIRHPGVGDLYLYLLLSDDKYGPQKQALFACSMDGLREVYSALPGHHGAMGSGNQDYDKRSINSPDCWEQRATNESIVTGNQLHVGDIPEQEPYLSIQEVQVVAISILTIKLQIAKNEHRLNFAVPSERDVVRVTRGLIVSNFVMSYNSVYSKNGTSSAESPQSIAGIHSNSEYLTSEAGDLYRPPVTWLEPIEDWVPGASEEAEVLGLLFKDANASQRCSKMSTSQLEGLRTQAQSGSSLRCDVCADFVETHIEVLDESGERVPELEPFCSAIDRTDNLVQSEAKAWPSSYNNRDVASDWCGCGILRDGEFSQPEDSGAWTLTGQAELASSIHSYKAQDGDDQFLLLRVEPNQTEQWAVGSQVHPYRGETASLSFDYKIVTHADHVQTSSCDSNEPFFAVRVGTGDPRSIGSNIFFRGSQDICDEVKQDSSVWHSGEWTPEQMDIELPDEADSALSFITVSNHESHYILVDNVQLTPKEGGE